MGACCHQGFSLPLSRWRRRPESDPALAFAFYPQAAGDLVAKCPEKAAPLLHLPLPEEPPRLLLRPPFYCSPDQAEGLARGEQLRPLLAALRHAGGHGEWHLFDGSWQLTLQLPEPVPTAGSDPAGHPAAARAPGRLADPTAGKYRYPSSHGSTPRTAGYIRASERLAGGPRPAAAQKMRSG